jgi:hypothetical protein
MSTQAIGLIVIVAMVAVVGMWLGAGRKWTRKSWYKKNPDTEK